MIDSRLIVFYFKISRLSLVLFSVNSIVTRNNFSSCGGGGGGDEKRERKRQRERER
jgi:hypothetical protein